MAGDLSSETGASVRPPGRGHDEPPRPKRKPAPTARSCDGLHAGQRGAFGFRIPCRDPSARIIGRPERREVRIRSVGPHLDESSVGLRVAREAPIREEDPRLARRGRGPRAVDPVPHEGDPDECLRRRYLRRYRACRFVGPATRPGEGGPGGMRRGQDASSPHIAEDGGGQAGGAHRDRPDPRSVPTGSGLCTSGEASIFIRVSVGTGIRFPGVETIVPLLVGFMRSKRNGPAAAERNRADARTAPAARSRGGTSDLPFAVPLAVMSAVTGSPVAAGAVVIPADEASRRTATPVPGPSSDG